MRQAIVTKYLGPTDYRGARIKAIAGAGSVTVSWDHALDTDDNHQFAAFQLARKFEWIPANATTDDFAKAYKGGGMPPSTGFANVYTCVN